MPSLHRLCSVPRDPCSPVEDRRPSPCVYYHKLPQHKNVIPDSIPLGESRSLPQNVVYHQLPDLKYPVPRPDFLDDKRPEDITNGDDLAVKMIGIPKYTLPDRCPAGMKIKAFTDPPRRYPYVAPKEPVAAPPFVAPPNRTKRNTCGLTGVHDQYYGPGPYRLTGKTDFLPQRDRCAIAAEAAECHVPWSSIPPYLRPCVPNNGTRIRICTDCKPKVPCPGYPFPAPGKPCPEYSPACEKGYYDESIASPAVNPCCLSDTEKEALEKRMRWMTTAMVMNNDIPFTPRIVSYLIN